MKIGRFEISAEYHHIFYIVTLCFVLFTLPFSYRAMSSIGIIVMTINWLFEGQFQGKLQRLKCNPGIWILASFYLTGVLGALYSDNFQQVIHHLQNGLAFFIVPFIVGTSRPLKFKEVRYLILTLTASVVLNSIVSYAILANILDVEVTNFRQYAYLTSNVHLSYMSIIAVAALFYFVTRKRKLLSHKEYLLSIVLIIWMTGYVFFLRSFSGVLIISALAWLLLVKRSLKIASPVKYLFLLLLLSLPLVPLYIFNQIYTGNFSDYSFEADTLSQYTAKGNSYTHDTTNFHLMENGRYIGLYLCEKELKQEWNERSNIVYSGDGKKGHPIRKTLIRYMTAKHLRKDSAGFAEMTKQDIRNVENGVPNPLYKKNTDLYYPRLYTLAQAIYFYKKTGRPFDSVTKRMEGYRAMLSIFSNNPVSGVGTGDIKNAYDSYYQQKYGRIKGFVGGHNQYLKSLATFGIIGFVWLIVSLLGSWIVQKGWKYTMAQMILVVILLSMISEVPFDQQRPAILFSVFYSLILFRKLLTGDKTYDL
ncbi:MAG: O-antigen ligase family protein [Bacteroidales bacterium]|nr:O-antigen ligase family protein [Bacteroidales bacterium]MCF8332523.1 O-antigen ligase family protein [Bacteroidales bacterium]